MNKQNSNQNTGSPENGEVINQSQKNPVGRPRDNNKRKFLFLNLDGKVRGKGKPQKGNKYIKVSVQRSIKPAKYIHGLTEIFSAEEIVADGIQKPRKTKIVNLIKPQIAPEIAPEAIEINQSNQVLA